MARDSFWSRTMDLAHLAWPSCITYLVQFSLQFWSMLFIGHLGEGYLGAAALANMTANLTGFSVGLGMATALDTLCAQAFGARKFKLVGLHCQRAMVILTLMCIPLAAIWLQTERLLLALGIEASIASKSGQYTRWLILGMWPWFMFECLRRFLQAQHIMWPIATSAGIVSALNLLLNYLLVIVAGLGFDGAAIATALSNWLLLTALVVLVLVRRQHRKSRRGRSYQLLDSRDRDSVSPDNVVLLDSASRGSASSDPSDMDMEDIALSPLGSSARSNSGRSSSGRGSSGRSNGYHHDNDDDDDDQDGGGGAREQDLADLRLLRPRSETAAAMAPTSIAPMFILTSSPFADGGDPDESWPPFFTRSLFTGWGEFFRLGLPSAISVFVEWGSFEVTSTLAARLGPVLLDTHTVFCQTVAIWYMPSLGLASSASTLIGNALGASRPQDARAYAWIALFWIFCYGCLNSGIFELFLRRWWATVFSNAEDVQESVYHNMPILFPYSVFDVVKCISMAIMRGCGRPNITVMVNVLSCVIVGYPLAFSLTFAAHGQLIGLWGAMATAWFTASTVYGIVVLRTNWAREADNAMKRSDDSGQAEISETKL